MKTSDDPDTSGHIWYGSMRVTARCMLWLPGQSQEITKGFAEMAKCDQGYLCDICGEEVEGITESDLYLRFVTGRLPAERLLGTPERHIRCNPIDAQFIQTAEFPPVLVEGVFSKDLLGSDEVHARTHLLTRGWLRLQQIAALPQPIPVADYPLEEFCK